MSDPQVPQSSPAEGLADHAWRAVSAITLVTLMLAGMWALEVTDYVVTDDNGANSLDQYGIRAHHVSDLPHIFSAPFLHAGFGHLTANSIPFLLLGFLAAFRGVGKFLLANLIVILVAGAGVWLTGPSDGVTLGASILIFGYFGYLLGRGVFERHLADIGIAVAVAAVYGTMIFGVLPSNPSISWQGHLFGLLGGLLSAWTLRRRRGLPE
ncbi:MAG: Rhomboid family protein [Actinomycetia bacterium]|nr:Rhomboid family protein [Actinomycetes bacterium]